MKKEVLITFTPDFKNQYKRLAKKHVSLESDIKELVSELQINPTLGISLGNNAYKIRLAISSKNKGKSGGARIITYFIIADTNQNLNELYLLSIYDKSEQENITNKALKKLIDDVIN